MTVFVNESSNSVLSGLSKMKAAMIEDYENWGENSKIHDKMSKEYYDSKPMMTDVEIKRFLMLNPVDFGNGYIRHSYHRACAMIGRLIQGKPYIPFYMEEKYMCPTQSHQTI